MNFSPQPLLATFGGLLAQAIVALLLGCSAVGSSGFASPCCLDFSSPFGFVGVPASPLPARPIPHLPLIRGPITRLQGYLHDAGPPRHCLTS